MKQFLKDAYNRFNSETPAFFKKIGAIGTATAITGGSIVTPEVAGAHIPDLLVKFGTHMLAIGAVMKAVAHLACVTPPDQPK